MLDPGTLLTMEGLHPETIHLLAADVTANLETGTSSAMEGLHPETIHLLATRMVANLETGTLLTMFLFQETIHSFFVGGRRGGQRGTGNGNANRFQGMQVDGQRLGVHGLQERTDELQGHGVIQHGTTDIATTRKASHIQNCQRID